MSADTRPAAPFSLWERSIALRYLRAKRKEGGVALIASISFVGIAAAVMVLIIVMSVMNGFRDELLSVMNGFNGHVYVTGRIVSQPSVRDPAVQRIRAVSGVIQATPMVEAQALVQGRGVTTGAIVRGLTPRDLRESKIIAGNIKAGSLRGFGEGDYGGDMIVVGDGLATSLGVEPGDALTLISPSAAATAFGSEPARVDYTVAATFDVGDSQFDNAFIYMPLEKAQLFFGRDQAVDKISIQLDSADRTDELRPKIVRAAGPNAIVTDWREQSHAYFNALQVERNTMALILSLIVLIAALNIISALVMLVKNKGRDIAILRTMGAGRGAVLRIFFMAGAMIGALGAMAGLALGILFCTYIQQIQAFVEWVTRTSVFSSDIYFLSHIPAKLDWGQVVLTTIGSLLASFLATLPPSLQASRIDPVEALRYE